MNKIVSVVIPCYNHGKYIQETLDSLSNCDNGLFEIIIINDGSTDTYTNQYLDELKARGYNVITQKNMGLGQARNTGIEHAKGAYILPLDADNKIFPDYIIKGIEILDKYPDVAVVYGNAAYFGNKKGVLKPGKFNLQRLMLGNYIDACAMVRKSVIEEVGYYDNMKIMGYEDWDLWLRIAFKGYKFYYVDETLFEYRVLDNSMMKSLNADIQKQNDIEEYFALKYEDKLSFDYPGNLFLYKIKKKPFRFLTTSFLRKFFPTYYSKLIKENKIYRGHLY